MDRIAFREAALAGGLPEIMADIGSDTDAGVTQGALFDDGGDLKQLIGRPTTPWRATITSFLRQPGASRAREIGPAMTDPAPSAA